MNGSKRIAPVLLSASALLSICPWLYQLLVLQHTADASLEGAWYLAALIGGLSFCITGPLVATVCLLAQMSQGRFIAVFSLTSAPTILYQGIVASASVVDLFASPGAHSHQESLHYAIADTVIAVAWYGAFYAVAVYAARNNIRAVPWVCLALTVVSFAVILLRVL